MDSLTGHLSDESATLQLGRAIGAEARAGDAVALVGELGAGKTLLTRGIAEGLGLPPTLVSSPTFTIVQEYLPESAPPEEVSAESKDGSALVLVHIDAYRLRDREELETIGWLGKGEELRRGAVVVIEWADRIAEALPDQTLWVGLDHQPSGRGVSLRADPSSPWAGRLATLMNPATPP